MNVIKLNDSLPQQVYPANVVAENEAKIAVLQNLSMAELMELAGECAFSVLKKQWPDIKSILVVCGNGNNAGDGFVVARLALAENMSVTLIQANDDAEFHGDAAIAKQSYIKAKGNITSSATVNMSQFDCIVDALLGTGLNRQVSDKFQQIINQINQSGTAVLSIDLPSGLSASTGSIMGACVKANITVSFIAIKQGLLTGQAVNVCGEIFFADLSIGNLFAQQIKSNVLLNYANYLPLLPAREINSHKGNSGCVLVIAGNKTMPGAARLAGEASLRSGAGLVAIACHKNSQALVFSGRPELMLASDDVNSQQFERIYNKTNVMVIGPGLGVDQWAQSFWQYAVKQNKPLVVDADALNLLAKSPLRRQHWILTPHPAEAARLLNTNVAEIEQDRFAAVTAIQHQYGGVCVLKGAGSLICDGHTTWINMSGNAGMATGGMGDVLSGIIAAMLLIAQQESSDVKRTQLSIIDAVKWAVYIHGKAADIAVEKDGQRGLLASDLFPYIRQLVNNKDITQTK